MRLNERVGLWAEEWTTVSAEGLGLARIFAGLFILLFLTPGDGVSHIQWISNLPGSLYTPPPGPMMFGSEFPSTSLLMAIRFGAEVSFLLMILGYRTKASSIAAGTLLLLLQGIFFSVGKIDHEILIAVVPLLMAFSNWGICYSIDEKSDRTTGLSPESWPLPMLALLIGFMMFTAGFPKILGGWLDPSTQATYGHLLNQFFVRERQELLAAQFLMIESRWFWELLDWGTVIFEIGFLVAVFRRRWFNLFLSIAVLFHFSTMMMLNIAFLPNFVAYAMFLNWEKIAALFQSREIPGRNERSLKKTAPVAFGLLLVILFLPLLVAGRSDILFAGSDLQLHEVVIVGSAMAGILSFLVLKGVWQLKTSS
ncbi:MAG: HTTM domain-containing protein [Balneolaceae bacterium]|nr:HTTM domain-containing protein [Balneolaceae bacterium]MCH8547452.1 HTTM domain-containing protein [Balneolaceae bacterium]